MTEEQLNAIEEMAYCLFAPDEIAIAIEMEAADFYDCLSDPSSPAYRAFYKGLTRQKLECRQAIIKAANNGSNPAQMWVMKMLDRVDSMTRD